MRKRGKRYLRVPIFLLCFWVVTAFFAYGVYAASCSSTPPRPTEGCELKESKVLGSNSNYQYTFTNGGYVQITCSDDDWAIFKDGEMYAKCDDWNPNTMTPVCSPSWNEGHVALCNGDGTLAMQNNGCDSDGARQVNFKANYGKSDTIDIQLLRRANLYIYFFECQRDVDHDGYKEQDDGGDDCDDTDANIHPGATEICNAKDDNCDGQVDEGLGVAAFRDADGDGFGNPDDVSQNCAPQQGYIANNTDCDDTDAAVKPTATEVCGNDKDDDCDGLQDEDAACWDNDQQLCEEHEFTWVGTAADGSCCGNTNDEYFLARTMGMDFDSISFPTGCWNSLPVDNDQTVSVSLVTEEENDWTPKPNTYFRLGSDGGRYNVHVVGVENGAYRGAVAQEISMSADRQYMLEVEVKTRGTATASIDLLNLRDEDPATETSRSNILPPTTSAQYQKFRIPITMGPGPEFGIELIANVPSGSNNDGAMFDNIDVYQTAAIQVLNSEGQYLGCKVREQSVLNTDDTNIPGTQHIVDNSADYCAVRGSWFCSKTNRWLMNEGDDRNTSKDAPPGSEDGANETFRPTECCGPDSCWTGYECVPSSGDGEVTPVEIGGQTYLCQDGVWTETEEKPNQDGTEHGYCGADSCFYTNLDEQRCVENGFWENDDLCEVGKWTSRTQKVALTLMEMAGDHYTIFCDSAMKSANRLAYTDGFPGGALAWKFIFGDSLPSLSTIPFCSDLPEGTPCANNLCVVRWDDAGTDKVAFGISLNEPLNKSFDYSILNLFEDSQQSDSASYYDYCDAAKTRSEDDGRYVGCAGKRNSVVGSPAKIWYDAGTQSLIYGEQNIVVGTPNLGQLFTDFLSRPFAKITRFISDLFASKGMDDYEFISEASDFRTLYLSKFADRQIRGIEEEQGGDRLTTVNFYNYRTDICKAVEDYCAANDVSPDNSCFGKVVSCQPTVLDSSLVFNVEGKNIPAASSFWSGLTAAIRTGEPTAPEGTVDFDPQIAAYDQSGARLSHPLTIREFFSVQLENTPQNPEDIIGYTWDFGDGTTTSSTDGAPAQHRYMEAGTYTITLRALDRYFGTHTANPIQVSVTSPCRVEGDSNADGVTNCIDVDCTTRESIGLPNNCQYVEICGDVMPQGEPDGMVDISDVSRVNQLSQGNVCPNCNNGIQDLQETGVDCGGGSCGNCPTCFDQLHNLDQEGNPILQETDADCGGPICAMRCGDQQRCNVNSDCAEGLRCNVGTCGV